MTPPILVRGARQLLTLRDAQTPRSGSRMLDLGIIPDGSVLIFGNNVEEVGSTRRVVNLIKARDAQVVDASGCVVLPGFVDPFIDLPVLKDGAIFFEHGTTAFGYRNASNKVRRQLERLSWIDSAPSPADIMGAGIVTPILSLFQNGHVASVRERIDSGADIAIATGFDGRRVLTHSMQAVIAIACTQMGFTVAEAIAAATTNAAHTIGMGHILGSLEPDKQADLVLLELPDYEKMPFHLGENLVRMVIKRGRVVYQRGERTWPEE